MKDSIKIMVDKFLSWKLPKDFYPDAGISFKADYNENTPYPMKHEPLGTNLFHAEQAMQMFEYCCAEELTKRESAAKQAGRDEVMKELSEMEPVGYIRAYGVECLQGTLMNETTGRIPLPSSMRIDPYPETADDIGLIVSPTYKKV